MELAFRQKQSGSRVKYHHYTMGNKTWLFIEHISDKNAPYSLPCELWGRAWYNGTCNSQYLTSVINCMDTSITKSHQWDPSSTCQTLNSNIFLALGLGWCKEANYPQCLQLSTTQHMLWIAVEDVNQTYNEMLKTCGQLCISMHPISSHSHGNI